MGQTPHRAPVMAFNPFSGTSGNFYAVVVPPTAGSDLIIVTGPPVPVPVLESVKYDFNFPLSSTASFVGFNSPADSGTRALYTRQLVGGVVDWTVTMEGAYSADSVSANSHTRLRQGLFVYFHLILDQSTGFGYRGLTGKISSMTGGADTKSSDADPVRIEIKGDGILYAPSLP